MSRVCVRTTSCRTHLSWITRSALVLKSGSRSDAMGTVQVTVKSVTPGIWEVSHELLSFVTEQLADDKPLEAIAALANREYYYGTLPGIPNPRIDPNGVVIDGDRRRQ